MKIAHVGNLANDGFAYVEALREAGVDAELIINETEFGMGLPQWETQRLKVDPYSVKYDELPPPPSWVKVLRGKYSFPRRVLEYNLATKPYDLLHLHYPTFLYLPFTSKKYVVCDAGFARIQFGDFKDSHRAKLARETYSRAAACTFTNTDMAEMVWMMGSHRTYFAPFAINTQRYTPKPRANSGDIQLLHPARMVFDVKGNDRMLRAYVKYIQGGGRAHLTLVDWGFEEDVAEAHKIVSPIEDSVTWVAPMSKPELIEAYQRSDAVLDQFTLGASGTTGFEAMSCGAPLMIYFAKSASEWFGEPPPCVNVSTEEEILAGFEALESDTLRGILSEYGRAFVERHLSYPVVAEKLKKIYAEVLEKDQVRGG